MGCTSCTQTEGQLTRLQRKRNIGVQKDSQQGTVNFLELSYAGTTMRGWRPYNQDAYLIQTQFKNTFFQGKLALFAVFDGHGGQEISSFAKRHFYEYLITNRDFQRGNFQSAFKDVFLAIDRDMMKAKGKQKIQNIRKQLRMNQRGGMNNDCLNTAGSTAVVVLVGEQNVIIANIGDSKALILGQNKEVLLETVDHRPSQPDERVRIEEAGGQILNGRIRGDLNVSRGIGDHYHKNLFEHHKSIVSAIPDVHSVPKSSVAYILMGSDGIWESPDPKDTFSYILKTIEECGSSREGLQRFFDEEIAKNPSSQRGMDNMTSIFINFKEREAMATSPI